MCTLQRPGCRSPGSGLAGTGAPRGGSRQGGAGHRRPVQGRRQQQLAHLKNPSWGQGKAAACRPCSASSASAMLDAAARPAVPATRPAAPTFHHALPAACSAAGAAYRPPAKRVEGRAESLSGGRTGLVGARPSLWQQGVPLPSQPYPNAAC